MFLKSIENKQVLYHYIKKKHKSQVSIGPFMKNNKIMEGSSAEILMNQYKSVYTIPREEFSLSKWSDLFNQYCSDCQAEKTHICIDDEPSYNILPNIFVDEE